MTLEHKLKRLTEVDPRWKHIKDGWVIGWGGPRECFGQLWIEGGQLQGGEALWFMFDSMVLRWAELRVEGTRDSTREGAILAGLLERMAQDMCPRLILSTYLAWKEVCQ